MIKFTKIGGVLLSTLSVFSANAVDVNYGEALQKSIYFYEAQQAGVLPDWNRVEWRGDSTLEDGTDVGEDLSGGWFDAGDHVKFGFPMAASATMLAWGVIENPEAYSQTGQLVHIKNNLRFVADYFIAAHPEPNVLYGQVGSGSADHSWWGPAEVMHLTSRAASTRPSYAITATCPGSDLAGETAAALAAIAMVFESSDSAYASTLLTHSEELYTFAKTYQGKYSDCITDASAFYNSWSGYADELVWSAAWLYKATGNQSYLDAAKADYANLGTEAQTGTKSYKWTHAWDDKSYGSYVLMAQLTNEAQYKEDAERWLDYWTDGYNGEKIEYTAGGLARLDQWGALRYTANTSFIALLYSDYLAGEDATNSRVSTYYNFAVSQIEYIMGDNPNGIIYQIGMSENGPKNPHHRTAHGSWADSLDEPVESRHLLVGALVGGPSAGDAYVDDRGDYISNEVATDYNAGFTSALARLYLDFGGDPIDDSQFPVAEVRDLEFYVEAKVNSEGPRYVEIGTNIYNHSAWPARNGSDLKFRYWVDLTSEMEKGYSVSDVTVSAAYTQASSISQLQAWGDASDNIYYTEVSFEGVDIFPGGQSDSKKEVQFRLSLPSTNDDADWDNSDDPSWADYTSAFAVSSAIAVYEGNELVWGEEPSAPCGGDSGINCAPTVDNLTTLTAFETSVDLELTGTDSDGSIAFYTVSSPSNGIISGAGDFRTYTPDDNFYGTDSFSYTATDNVGAESSAATITVTVAEPLVPSVVITTPSDNAEVYVGEEFALSFNYSNAAAVSVLVEGTEVVASTTSASVIVIAPSTAQSFLVEVVALDENGEATTASDSLSLSAIEKPINGVPTAVISSSVSGLTVNFDCGLSTDPDDDALTCSWDFGGGHVATGNMISYTFIAEGAYTVSLMVSDGIDTDTATETVTVLEPIASANCEYILSNEWNTGFVANIRISNNSTEVIDSWQVSWEYAAGTVRTSGWNAVVTGANPYIATPLAWNSQINPGEYVEFGVQGSKPTDQAASIPVVVGDVCD
ncbi:MAG: glycoside hydrolase family 9 protein [Paraglaciecola sp.]|uniref:glycoside hydrolase family 9 protein n=1 Tax=Paraglaciecola sp. TaxID=1920173 RepID=UPI0032968AB3